MSETSVLRVEHLTKTYRSGERTLTVLRDVSLSVQDGSRCAIVGPSGSGKTTLLGLCAGLDRPTSGTVALNGVGLNGLNEDELAQVRNQHVGFVFQTFQLIPTLTALENVVVPIELRVSRGQKAGKGTPGAGGSRRSTESLSRSTLGWRTAACLAGPSLYQPAEDSFLPMNRRAILTERLPRRFPTFSLSSMKPPEPLWFW